MISMDVYCTKTEILMISMDVHCTKTETLMPTKHYINILTKDFVNLICLNLSMIRIRKFVKENLAVQVVSKNSSFEVNPVWNISLEES